MREKALEWWNTLRFKQQMELVKKYKPEWVYSQVTRSQETIEIIYAGEHPDEK